MSHPLHNFFLIANHWTSWSSASLRSSEASFSRSRGSPPICSGQRRGAARCGAYWSTCHTRYTRRWRSCRVQKSIAWFSPCSVLQSCAWWCPTHSPLSSLMRMCECGEIGIGDNQPSWDAWGEVQQGGEVTGREEDVTVNIDGEAFLRGDDDVTRGVLDQHGGVQVKTVFTFGG